MIDTPADTFSVGTQIAGLVSEIRPPKRPKAKSTYLIHTQYEGWRIEIDHNSLSPADSRFLRVGDEVSGWVVRKLDKHRFATVSLTDIGRLPPPPQELKRLVDSLYAICAYAASNRDGLPPMDDFDVLATAFNEITRKTSPCWFFLYSAFGFIDDLDFNRVRTVFITDFMKVLSDISMGYAQEREKFSRAFDRLLEIGVIDRFRTGAKRLVDAASDWAIAKLPIPVKEHDLVLSNDTKLTLAGCKDAERRTATLARSRTRELPVVDAPDMDKYEDLAVRQIEAAIKREKATQGHRLLVNEMASCLRCRLIECAENSFIDLYANIDETPVIFEMKTVTPTNCNSQIRKAISQLYEYRYLHDMRDALLCIVLDHFPYEGWMTRYLHEDRGMALCWWSTGYFAYQHRLSPILDVFARCSQSQDATEPSAAQRHK